jgi:hypothetical protein
MGEPRRGVRLAAVGQDEGHTARGPPLAPLMEHGWRHRQGAIADVEGQPQLGHGGDRSPPPGRGACQARARRGLAAVTLLDGPE